ncbi:ATP-binding cassette domain-containing protein [Actinomadura parmotrematis]|uniref:ATP-binding cassette domain-containing protein n=1 Tax=Actinomadura parmotrematis TaxID=2864039 RepID=A0ABS7G544_9ACTN|nr:ATP-binding cassette domain-containing protein [Actinomadura parmotrematis]MBW8487651.1 ATP-binding cassette domain-containing protein [Actinomadura parmotrematis]
MRPRARTGPYRRITLALLGSATACATLGLRARPGLGRHGPEGGAGLRADGVTVRFGDVVAVRGAALEAPAGAVTGLVGPAGAGKSTLLDALSGLRRAEAGRVRLGDGDLTGRAAARARRGLGRTFERPVAFGGLTVRENVQVAAEIHAMTRPVAGRGPRDRRRRRRAARRDAGSVADALLARVGIAEYAGRRAAGLPPGPARLLELARALAARPSVLLLDEPFAGLPEAASRSLEVLLRDLAAEGLAVVVAAPEVEPVLGVCDTLYLLDAGRVTASGPPLEVARRVTRCRSSGAAGPPQRPARA